MFRFAFGTLVVLVCLLALLGPAGRHHRGLAWAATATAATAGTAEAAAATLPASMPATATVAAATATAAALPATSYPLAEDPLVAPWLPLIQGHGWLPLLALGIVLLLAFSGLAQRLPADWRAPIVILSTAAPASLVAYNAGLGLSAAIAAGLTAGTAVAGTFSGVRPVLGRIPVLGALLKMAPKEPKPPTILK